MTKNEVAKTEKSEVAEVYDYGEMSHEGFEDTTIDDLSIPFLNVLQSNSPEVEEQTVPGAKAGDILNSVTGEIMKQPIVVQPVLKEGTYVEWVPRNKGGGLVGRVDPANHMIKKMIEDNGGSKIPPKGEDGKRIPFKSPAGNDLIETFYVYVLIMNEEGTEVDSYGVLAFSSTKIKKYKDWMTSMYTIKGRPPMIANRAKISTVREKNESGTYYNFHIAPLRDTWRESLIPPSESSLLKEAQEFREMIDSGLARPDMEGGPTRDHDQSGGAESRPADTEDIPF